MGAWAVFHYRPDGFAAGLIIFVGAYTLTHSLRGRTASRYGLFPNSCSAHPGIAQAYWFWEQWPVTAGLSHPLTAMCAAWLALLGGWLLARTMLANGPALQSN